MSALRARFSNQRFTSLTTDTTTRSSCPPPTRPRARSRSRKESGRTALRRRGPVAQRRLSTSERGQKFILRDRPILLSELIGVFISSISMTMTLSTPFSVAHSPPFPPGRFLSAPCRRMAGRLSGCPVISPWFSTRRSRWEPATSFSTTKTGVSRSRPSMSPLTAAFSPSPQPTSQTTLWSSTCLPTSLPAETTPSPSPPRRSRMPQARQATPGFQITQPMLSAPPLQPVMPPPSLAPKPTASPSTTRTTPAKSRPATQ